MQQLHDDANRKDAAHSAAMERIRNEHSLAMVACAEAASQARQDGIREREQLEKGAYW